MICYQLIAFAIIFLCVANGEPYVMKNGIKYTLSWKGESCSDTCGKCIFECDKTGEIFNLAAQEIKDTAQHLYEPIHGPITFRTISRKDFNNTMPYVYVEDRSYMKFPFNNMAGLIFHCDAHLPAATRLCPCKRLQPASSSPTTPNVMNNGIKYKLSRKGHSCSDTCDCDKTGEIFKMGAQKMKNTAQRLYEPYHGAIAFRIIRRKYFNNTMPYISEEGRSYMKFPFDDISCLVFHCDARMPNAIRLCPCRIREN